MPQRWCASDSVAAAEARKKAAAGLAEPAKSTEIAAANTQMAAAYAVEAAEKSAAAARVTEAKALEALEFAAASAEVESAKHDESLEKAAAVAESAAARADYELEIKTISNERSAAKSDYDAEESAIAAERHAAHDEHEKEQHAAESLAKRADSDYEDDMAVVNAAGSERDDAVRKVRHLAAPDLSAAGEALADNDAAFVEEMLAATAALDNLAGRAPSGSPLQKLISDTAKKARERLARTPRRREQMLLQSLGLERSYLTGASVGVAVIDSGIDNAGGRFNVVHRYDFTATGVSEKTSDDYGHGTHVSGLIGGNGIDTLGFDAGIAPGVRLIDLKVLDEAGAGFTSDVVLAVEFAIANRDALGIDVINLSLGHPIYEPAASDPLVLAVERAVDAGIVVVVSAGNVGRNLETGEIGYAGVTSPGNAPSASPSVLSTRRAPKPVTTTKCRQLQLARSDVVRRLCEARRGGPGDPTGVRPRQAQHACRHAGEQRGRRELEAPEHDDPERHQHGHRCHQRRRGADDRGQSLCGR